MADTAWPRARPTRHRASPRTLNRYRSLTSAAGDARCRGAVVFAGAVYPVELFFSLKLFAALGNRKVGQNAILWNRNRREIFASIAANPGVRFTALERLTGIKEGTLKYHLLILETKRRIVSFGSGRSLRYFENNGRYNSLKRRSSSTCRTRPRGGFSKFLPLPPRSQGRISPGSWALPACRSRGTRSDYLETGLFPPAKREGLSAIPFVLPD